MQKNTPKLYRVKNNGISLLISVLISFFVLGMTMAILISVNKSLQNAVGIERFNQATFAAEAGLEAAFFHHNARGQGVDFGNIAEIGSDQTLVLPTGEVRWTISGRTAQKNINDVSNEQVLTGLLKEGQTITLPLYFDNTDSVSDDPKASNAIVNEQKNFRLKFARYEFAENGNPIQTNENLIIPTGFDFGLTENAPVINWSVSRKRTDGVLETFIPTTILDQGRLPCDSVSHFPSDTGYICRSNMANVVNSVTIRSTPNGSSPIGKILPGETLTTLYDFINGSEAHSKPNITINFRALTTFEDTDGNKIPGIPWALELTTSTNDDVIPKHFYEAEVLAVDQNDYRRYVRTEVMEETAVGVLDVLTLE